MKMKVLMLAPYIYNPEINAFSRNKSGFGMMVHDIAKWVSAAGCNVEVLTNVLTKEIKGEYKYVRHTKSNVLFNAKLSGVKKYLKENKELITSFKAKLKLMYYYFNLGYVKRYIKKCKPDIVHIHGMGTLSSYYVDICRELKVPCAVTAHGLLEHDAAVTATGKRQEIEFFSKLEKDNIPVSVISSGIKRRLTEDYYGLKSSDNVTVVCNATNVAKNQNAKNIRDKLSIPEDAKVVLCVGNLLRQKNQIQVLDAYNELSEGIKKKTYLVFAGDILNGYPVKEKIEAIAKNIYGADGVDYSAAANRTIASLEEMGFGDLPICVLGFYFKERTTAPQELIFDLKRSRSSDAHKLFARLMSARLLKEYVSSSKNIADTCITYPPRSEDNKIKYGFDHGKRLARSVANFTGAKFEDVFVRSYASEQKFLSRNDRLSNADSSLTLSASADVRGKDFIIIDDIITTGATLKTCVKLLRSAGARSVRCAALLRNAPKPKSFTSKCKDDVLWFE